MCAYPTTAHILSVMVDEEEGCEKFSRIPPTHLKFFSFMLIHIFTVSF
jgi:hypothetical protein